MKTWLNLKVAASFLVSRPNCSDILIDPASHKKNTSPMAGDNAIVNTPIPAPLAAQALANSHYENFPVASWLCPAQLRPPIAAIYAFARTADDLADEGTHSPAQRLADLALYRQDLHACAQGQTTSGRWPMVFAALEPAIAQHRLPVALLDALLSAFIQDVEKTRDGAGYATRAELLDYCSRSANPVGRLLLHLYGIDDAQALEHSDAICTALQLINFWQDLSEDLPRGRYYLTDADCQRFGVTRADLLRGVVRPEIQKLLADSAEWARLCMQKGLKLVHTIPGRMGWELRLVVQGGLRTLEHVQALQGANLHTRVTLSVRDAPVVLWRAIFM